MLHESLQREEAMGGLRREKADQYVEGDCDLDMALLPGEGCLNCGTSHGFAHDVDNITEVSPGSSHFLGASPPATGVMPTRNPVPTRGARFGMADGAAEVDWAAVPSDLMMYSGKR